VKVAVGGSQSVAGSSGYLATTSGLGQCLQYPRHEVAGRGLCFVQLV